MNKNLNLTALGLALVLTGCKSIGPNTITRDRFDYGGAVADSWKSQMLLNLVKIRYGDAPVFLDVGQIVAGYSFQRSLSASATGNTYNNNSPANTVAQGTFGLTASGSYNDSPTITYTPLTGERFARQLMTPIPPVAIMNVIQAGFPVNEVFRLSVQAVNGIDNRRVKGLYVQPAEPEFYSLLHCLQRIQDSGDFGVQSRETNGMEVLEMLLRPHPVAAVERSYQDLTSMLGLEAGSRTFRVAYGALPSNDKEIAILSRSIYEVLTDISSSIAVPEAHVSERRVGPTAEPDLGSDGPIPPLVRIVESKERPADAYVAVPYAGYWFSIDNKDLPSKKMFSFIMLLFTFVERGNNAATPVLTIPTTR